MQTTKEINRGPSMFGILGITIAAILSFSVNNSIFWAIIHGIFGWFYIVYYVLFKL